MRRFLITLCACLWFSPLWASTNVTATYVEVSPEHERITLEFNAKAQLLNHFVLESPPRLVIDLARLSSGAGVGLSKEYRGSALRNIRFGQYDKRTSRVVIDLTQMVKKPSVYMAAPNEKQSWRLVIDIARPQPLTDADQPVPEGWERNIAPTSKPAAPTEPIDRVVPETLAQDSAQTVSKAFSARKGVTPEGWVPTPSFKPTNAARNARKPVVVIDAGHGGKDSGALGRAGVMEKDITLQYSKALKAVLDKTGRYEVRLTRNDDRFLFLRERVRVARRYKGDVFLSIHADANPNPRAQGLSTYTLSEEASDAETAALAAQENKADIIGGVELAHADEAVADILIDLATRETKNKSSNLADTIISNMDASVPLLTNPHRYAGFRVLKAPDIPSVLIEVGFLTNRSDERRILSRGYRNKVTSSIVRALDDYFKQHPKRP